MHIAFQLALWACTVTGAVVWAIAILIMAITGACELHDLALSAMYDAHRRRKERRLSKAGDPA